MEGGHAGGVSAPKRGHAYRPRLPQVGEEARGAGARADPGGASLDCPRAAGGTALSEVPAVGSAAVPGVRGCLGAGMVLSVRPPGPHLWWERAARPPLLSRNGNEEEGMGAAAVAMVVYS